MARTYGVRVVDCPDCNKPIGADHPYTWCCECGEQLSAETQAQIPAIAKRAAAAKVRLNAEKVARS